MAKNETSTEEVVEVKEKTAAEIAAEEAALAAAMAAKSKAEFDAYMNELVNFSAMVLDGVGDDIQVVDPLTGKWWILQRGMTHNIPRRVHNVLLDADRQTTRAIMYQNQLQQNYINKSK